MNPTPCGPASCTPIVTNVPGPQGNAGATGAQGAIGATGPQGPAGTSWNPFTYSAYGNSSTSTYQLASSGAAPTIQLLNLSPQAPSVVLAVAGTYLLLARVRIDMSGLTTGGTTTTITTKLRCVNNTIADVPNTNRVFDVYNYLSTVGTGTLAELTVPPVVYTATAGDNIQIWGAASAVTSAGTIFCVEADILAIKII